MRLFLSYSRQDLAIIQEIFFRLRAANYDVWFDQEDIPAGSHWEQEIKKGLEAADIIILFASRYSLKSSNVKHEWVYALESLKKPVAVWWIDDYPLDPQLKELPVLDLRSDPLNMDLCLAAAKALVAGEAMPKTENPLPRPAYIEHFLSRLDFIDRYLWVLQVVCLLCVFINPLLIFLIPFIAYDQWRRRGFRRSFEARAIPFNVNFPYVGSLSLIWLSFLTYGLGAKLMPGSLTCILSLFLFTAPVWLISVLQNPKGIRFWMGYEPFEFQSQAVKALGGQSEVPFFLQSNSSGMEFLYSNKLYAWLPGFRPQKVFDSKKPIWAVSDNPFTRLEAITIQDDGKTIVAYHPIDRFFVDYLLEKLGSEQQPVLKNILELDFQDGYYAGITILVLSRASQKAIEALSENTDLLSKSGIFTVKLEQQARVPKALESYQYFDVSSWAFSRAQGEVLETISRKVSDFQGITDSRADPNRGTPGGYLTLWFFAYLWFGICLFFAIAAGNIALSLFLGLSFIIFFVCSFRLRPLALGGWAFASSMILLSFLVLRYLSMGQYDFSALNIDPAVLTFAALIFATLSLTLCAAPLFRRSKRLAKLANVGNNYNPLSAVIWSPNMPLIWYEVLLIVVAAIATAYFSING